MSYILEVPFWRWSSVKDGLFFHCYRSRKSWKKKTTGHCLGCQAAFLDQMPKNALGTLHLKGFF